MSQARVAIITGASAGTYTSTFIEPLSLLIARELGIGRATAVALSANGWRVALSGRRLPALQATAKLCSGVPPLVCAGDVSNEDDVAKLFADTNNEFGASSSLVCNINFVHFFFGFDHGYV